MDAREAAWETMEKIQAGFLPPEKLADVVKPGDLASLVPAERWEPLRDIRRKLEAAQALSAQVTGKLSEVEHALQGLEARRPRDAAAIADAVLAGQALSAEPPEKPPEGIAAMGRERLVAARDGLRQKKQEVEGEAQWHEHQLRKEEGAILKEAVTKASADYADLVRGALSDLHVAIDGGVQLLNRVERDPPLDTHTWRQEHFLAGPYTPSGKRIEGAYGARNLLVNFSNGAGVPGVMEAWRRAVKAACGISSF